MNEELQNALAQMIERIVATMSDGIAFAQEQIPDVLQQLLTYKLVTSGLILAAAVSVLGVYYFRALPTWWKASDSDSEKEALMFLSAIVTAIFGFLVAASSFLQILLAPKVYLIEYAANLAK